MSTATAVRQEAPAAATDSGDPTALLARTQDLSRRLQEREEFYRAVLESLGEGVLITDRENRILYANSRVECLTGRTRAEMLGAISHELLTPKSEWPAMRRRLKERLAGKEDTYELEHVRSDGGRHWVSVRAMPYRNARGDIVGTIGLMSCIKERKSLEFENEYLQEELRGNYSAIVGDSPALKKVLSQIEMVAPTNANVLILGASGTGKELVARAIHDRSPRKAAALVRVNCASVPRELFESEFFGHVRGAFTGALRDRIGRFELADGGTLFLDEVGEIPLELQGKLLRVLQEGNFERVGEERTRTVDVRLIAATNRNLKQEVQRGRFREDLYFRLNVFPVESVPLRERREDIPLLAQHFLTRESKALKSDLRLREGDARRLARYDWPGNVRELQNVIERAAILAHNGRLRIDLPEGAGAQPATGPGRPKAERTTIMTASDMREHERANIVAALEACAGKVFGPGGAAELLDLKPTTLASRIKALGIRAERG